MSRTYISFVYDMVQFANLRVVQFVNLDSWFVLFGDQWVFHVRVQRGEYSAGICHVVRQES